MPGEKVEQGATGAVSGSTDKRIRVAVVDDHPIMREGLVHTFQRETDFEVVARGASAQEAIEIAQTLAPDVMLLDITMPGNGIEAARVISRTCPSVRIAMLSAHDVEEYVIESLQVGASGYLLKGVSSSELIQTARAIHQGEAYVSPGLAAKLLTGRDFGRDPGAETAPTIDRERAYDGFVTLSSREEQILRYVSRGLSNKEVAESIGLAEKTVKHYMTNILNKLRVRNRVEAALIARQRLGRE